MNQKSKTMECELIIAKSCGRLIGFEVRNILGITENSDIFKIPQLRSPLLGLGRYLNKVLAVVDTGLFCGLRRTEKHQIRKWIITETSNGLSAFAVDDVIGIKKILLKGKTSKKKIVINNFEFEGKSGDLLNIEDVLPTIENNFEKREFTKIENDKINSHQSTESKTFLCFMRDSIDSAIEMSSVVSVHNMNECEEPFVKIKKNVVLGNLNNQLVPIFQNKSKKNLVLSKLNDRIFGIACDEIVGIRKIKNENIFFEETKNGEKKHIAFQNENLSDTKIINIIDLLKINPIENWMPKNLILENITQKSYDNNFLFFKILDFNFGLPLEKIKRVDFFKKPKRIRNLKKGILGVSDLEQKTVIIIDFLNLLNIHEIEDTDNKHKEIIFIETEKGKIGLAVNEITGIKTVNLNNLKESSNFDGMPTNIYNDGNKKTFFPQMETFQDKLSDYLT